MKSIVIATAFATILGTASSRPLNLKRGYYTEIVYVTEYVTDAVLYVDQDGVPYSTSIVEHSTVATSVDVVTTSDSVPTSAQPYSAPNFVSSSAASALLTSSTIMPSFSIVASQSDSASVQINHESTTSVVAESSLNLQQVSPAPTAQEPAPEFSSTSPVPPPSSTPAPISSSTSAPVSSSASPPASSQSPQAEKQDGNSLPIGVTYDPFTGSRDNTRCKTATEINDEFSKMGSYGIVRIYGMGCDIIPLAVQNAQKNGQTLMGGAYLSNKGNGEDLGAVITTWKNVIDQYAGGSWDILKLFAVENERINDHDMTAEEVVSAIGQGRDQLRGVGYNGPVGAVETVPATLDNPTICQEADAVMVNCHPFFDENTTAEDAGSFVKSQIEQIKATCNTDRVIITETGWPHQGDTNGKAVPSPENQAKALASIRSEFTSDVFLHNSFDSPWKSDWASSFNAERYWGVIQ